MSTLSAMGGGLCPEMVPPICANTGSTLLQSEGAFWAVCIFDKVFASFWYLTRKNSHKNKMHINWHVQFRFWHVKKKTTHQLTLYKLKWHVVLGMWHWGDILEKNVHVNWHSFFIFENVMWHFWIRSWTSNKICQTYTLLLSLRLCTHFSKEYIYI